MELTTLPGNRQPALVEGGDKLYKKGIISGDTSYDIFLYHMKAKGTHKLHYNAKNLCIIYMLLISGSESIF